MYGQAALCFFAMFDVHYHGIYSLSTDNQPLIELRILMNRKTDSSLFDVAGVDMHYIS